MPRTESEIPIPGDLIIVFFPCEVDLRPIIHLLPQVAGVLLHRHDPNGTPVGVPFMRSSYVGHTWGVGEGMILLRPLSSMSWDYQFGPNWVEGIHQTTTNVSQTLVLFPKWLIPVLVERDRPHDGQHLARVSNLPSCGARAASRCPPRFRAHHRLVIVLLISS